MQPNEKLKSFKKQYPKVFEEFDKINAEFESNGTYSSIMSNMNITAVHNQTNDYFKSGDIGNAIEATALYLWSKNKYSFIYDEILQSEFYCTPLPKSTKYLKNMPCVCPYIDLNDEESFEISGFWFWINKDAQSNDVIQFLFLLWDGDTISLPIEILDDFQSSINKALGKNFLAEKETALYIREYDEDKERLNYIMENLKFYLNIVLYICSEECDMNKKVTKNCSLKESRQIKEIIVGEEEGGNIGDSYIFKKIYEDKKDTDLSILGYEKVESHWEENENDIKWIAPFFGIL